MATSGGMPAFNTLSTAANFPLDWETGPGHEENFPLDWETFLRRRRQTPHDKPGNSRTKTMHEGQLSV